MATPTSSTPTSSTAGTKAPREAKVDPRDEQIAALQNALAAAEAPAAAPDEVDDAQVAADALAARAKAAKSLKVGQVVAWSHFDPYCGSGADVVVHGVVLGVDADTHAAKVAFLRDPSEIPADQLQAI